MKSIRKVFGQRVRAAREKRGLNQYALAEILGVDQPAVSRIENARQWTHFGLAFRIMSELGIRPDPFLKISTRSME